MLVWKVPCALYVEQVRVGNGRTVPPALLEEHIYTEYAYSRLLTLRAQAPSHSHTLKYSKVSDVNVTNQEKHYITV